MHLQLKPEGSGSWVMRHAPQLWVRTVADVEDPVQIAEIDNSLSNTSIFKEQ